MEQKKERLIIIDSNSIIHRAYHALPPLATTKGEVVGAIYGFLLVFLKAVREFRPDCIAAAFDFPGPTFRHKEFREYKAKRLPTPEDLSCQIPKIKDILKSFEVPIFEKEGFEADDIIGTIAALASKERISPEIETVIVSGDSDSLQLINPKTKVYLLRKGIKDTILYDENKVLERYQGLKPEQIVDFKALKGDPSDNIPGVTGVGEKTAIELIREFGNLGNLYQNLEGNTEKAKKIKPKLRELLSQAKEQAFLSKTLAQIKKDVPIEFNLQECYRKEYDKEKAAQELKKLEFYSLIARLPSPGAKMSSGQERLPKFKAN